MKVPSIQELFLEEASFFKNKPCTYIPINYLLQPSQALEEPPPAVQSIEIDLKCGEKVTDSDSEGLDTRDYLPSHHDHTRRPKPIKAR